MQIKSLYPSHNYLDNSFEVWTNPPHPTTWLATLFVHNNNNNKDNNNNNKEAML